MFETEKGIRHLWKNNVLFRIVIDDHQKPRHTLIFEENKLGMIY